MPNTASHLASISTAAILRFSYCLSLRFRRIDVFSTQSIGESNFFFLSLQASDAFSNSAGLADTAVICEPNGGDAGLVWTY
jgi:hypothetical protein